MKRKKNPCGINSGKVNSIQFKERKMVSLKKLRRYEFWEERSGIVTCL